MHTLSLHRTRAMHRPARHHGARHAALVALVAAALGLALSDAHGQNTAAAGEGRPAMAGAQGGMGAQPGLQQGGLAVEGNAGAQIDIPLRRPGRSVEPPPSSNAAIVQAAVDNPLPAPDVRPGRKGEVQPAQSAPRKASRAAKRSLDRARHGVGQVDAQGGAKAQP